MRERGVVVHYGEIGLKGGMRHPFERRLGDRLRQALESVGQKRKVSLREGRFYIPCADEPADVLGVVDVVTRIPGVVYALPVLRVEPEMEAVKQAACELLAEAPEGSFKVESRRLDKSLDMTSIDISRDVAGRIAATTGRPADVHTPDIAVRVVWRKQEAYISAYRVEGPGGLPVGSSGAMLGFLSGGLDSPVAIWHMLRRGALVTAVHFHNRTIQGRAVLEKIEDLCGVLAWTAGRMPLRVVPFEGCQRAIVGLVPAAYRMIVYRRAMFRIASRLARMEHALGYITGDSLGQVASQTLENLHTIQSVADLPVYAPLCGMDKTEIVHRARQIGTYDISIRPHEDCCSFMIADSPATKSSPEHVLELEADLDWDALVDEAVAGTTKDVVRPG